MGKAFKFIGIGLLIILTGCQLKSKKMQDMQLDEKGKIVRDYVVKNAIIAHRGTTFWAPEETEAAYRWSRNMGADYLEVDIQRSKDGVLLALHDNNLMRTSDCETVFPKDSSYNAGKYTYQELMQLDAGSWFNSANPDRKRGAFTKDAAVIKTNQKAYSFSGKDISAELDTLSAIQHPANAIYIGGKQHISTLEDVLMIAKGWRIAKNEKGERLYNLVVVNSIPHYQFLYVKDDKDNGNRPGIYIETKEPDLYPEVESDLYAFLKISGWNIAENEVKSSEVYYKNKRVNTGNTDGRIVLQTFSPRSLANLADLFKGKVPVCFLLWLGDPNLPLADSAHYQENINYALKNRAHFIGPSIAGKPNNYADLLENWQAKLIHQSGLKIHAYSFDTEEQTEIYAKRTDAMFTNRTDLTIQFYKNKGFKPGIPVADAIQTLMDLGY